MEVMLSSVRWIYVISFGTLFCLFAECDAGFVVNADNTLCEGIFTAKGSCSNLSKILEFGLVIYVYIFTTCYVFQNLVKQEMVL